MYTETAPVVLKNGEKVSAGIVVCPDSEWAPRLKRLLGHKPLPYTRQISELLTRDTGVDTRFFILHREGIPFANIMTAERSGSGFFGHVWTDQADRKKGASSEIMKMVLRDFEDRKSGALFLGTGFDTVAYHFYRKYGFEPLMPGSGSMVLYADGPEKFDKAYFTDAGTRIVDFGWPHWPASAALFAGDYPGCVRCAGEKIFGRQITEGPFLKLLYRIFPESGKKEHPVPAVVLENTETGAMTGFASHTRHPLWPRTTVVDLYCHPRFWNRAGELLNALVLPDAARILAYADEECPEKILTLESAGFRKTTMLGNMLSIGESATDILVFEKQ